MMTREEMERERTEIKAWLKAHMRTRKKLNATCREIMASEESDDRKAFLVKREAESYLDDASHRFPEIRAINARIQAMEDEHTGTPDRPTYCPTCGTWSPAPPLKWVGLCRDWARTKRALIKKVASTILKRKAA
jgi:hypothetical protein